jgi:hypothetical protein
VGFESVARAASAGQGTSIPSIRIVKKRSDFNMVFSATIIELQIYQARPQLGRQGVTKPVVQWVLNEAVRSSSNDLSLK